MWQALRWASQDTSLLLRHRRRKGGG